MRTLSALLCLVPLSLAAEIVSRDGAKTAFNDETHELISKESDRDEKFLSVFQIVKFNNEMCPASDGNMGVCFTEAECTAKGGVATGACAETFGVCCVFKANTCGSTVNQLVSYVESPSYPSSTPTGMCMFNVGKCDTGVCQYKVTFEDVQLSGPASGECTNDTMIVSNVDTVSAALMPTNLCGTLSGSEIYLTVNDTTVDPKFTFNIASNAAKYRLKIEQIACTKTDELAPPGCLTYADTTSGTIMSFNNQAGDGELLNNHKYSHCIKYQTGFCDMSLTSTDFDLGADDMIAFGTSSLTGSTFGTAGSLIYNFTGPYVIPTMHGSTGGMESGYSLSYLLLPC